ncbi:cryptic plasmid protein A [Candidatus Accumulibacter phosphatis]|jgi:hypothetical protein|uniref:Cryptic plasmid protein A n=1 Tax=Candidatus Accumulibacter phosphatis TaxID=327160 RepID=A0ABX1U6B1_9PROT|nr:cryptic plasmid protein A [Candidatus Accumulibacter phosphatis]MBE2244802.1 cryptic plasmid protein A [Burkholderiaceae bacterium]NMQ30363.1 cryptic plasmid protein A [Candidatus Accumulibacter phosphatis]
MNVILETERDRRTLAWLIQQVGEPALQRACATLAGRRKCYPSNLAKCLGLVPPESLVRPSSEQVQAYLNDMRALLKHPTLERRVSHPEPSKNP